MTAYDAVLFDTSGVLVEPPAREPRGRAARAALPDVGIEVCWASDSDPDAVLAARERHDERSEFGQYRAGTRTTSDDVTAILDLPGSRGVVRNDHHSTVEFVLEVTRLV